MNEIDLRLDGDKCWPDLVDQEVTWVKGAIGLGCLRHGTTAGNPSVAFRLDLTGGRTVCFETTMRVLLAATDAMRAVFGEADPLAAILEAGDKGWWRIEGRECSIELAPRPSYCNRGNWIATLQAAPIVGIDDKDGWPRYYFDFDRGISELDAWLSKRGQSIGASWLHQTR